MSKTTKQMLAETESFFKAAFCVDGEAKMLELKSHGDFKIDSIIQLTDSERGLFHIAIVSPMEASQ